MADIPKTAKKVKIKKKEKEDLRYIVLHESNDYIDNTSVK